MGMEQGPDFDWETPGKRERLRRFGNRILYFFDRRRTTYDPPPLGDLDRPPEHIPEADKDDWHFPEKWIDQSKR